MTSNTFRSFSTFTPNRPNRPMSSTFRIPHLKRASDFTDPLILKVKKEKINKKYISKKHIFTFLLSKFLFFSSLKKQQGKLYFYCFFLISSINDTSLTHSAFSQLLQCKIITILHQRVEQQFGSVLFMALQCMELNIQMISHKIRQRYVNKYFFLWV